MLALLCCYFFSSGCLALDVSEVYSHLKFYKSPATPEDDETGSWSYWSLNRDQPTLLLHHRAAWLVELQHYEEALPLCNELVECQTHGGLHLRGKVYENLGKYDLALADVRKCKSTADEIRLLLELGRKQDALYELNKKIGSDKAFYGAQYLRARLKEELGDEADAIQDYRTAAKISMIRGDKNLMQECNHRAAMLSKQSGAAYPAEENQHQIKAAKTTIEASASSSNSIPRTWVQFLNSGTEYARTDQTDKALASFNASIKLHPNHRVYIERSKLYARTGNFKLALKDACSAIDVASGVWDVYANRAAVYSAMNHYPEAIVD